MGKEKFKLIAKRLRDRGFVVSVFKTAIQASEYIDSQIDGAPLGLVVL